LADPDCRVPVLVGPTAVGKTAVVLELAGRWPLTVISADSRQVYRGLNIGTAKPTPEQLRRVPHVGIDVVDPGHRFSAGRFAREAARWLAAVPTSRQPVVVGGTGFYIRALVDGLFREPPMDGERRERLRRWARSAEGLGRWAARLDSGYSGGGRQRAARTVEVALLTGRSLSWWQHQAKADPVMVPWYIRLTAPRSVLHQRIDERVAAMLDGGWIDEVRELLDRGIAPDAAGLDAVGYRQVVAHVQGRVDAAELAAMIASDTKRYAKRQETWFRHQLTGGVVTTLDAAVGPGELADRIATLWEERRD